MVFLFFTYLFYIWCSGYRTGSAFIRSSVFSCLFFTHMVVRVSRFYALSYMVFMAPHTSPLFLWPGDWSNTSLQVCADLSGKQTYPHSCLLHDFIATSRCTLKPIRALFPGPLICSFSFKSLSGLSAPFLHAYQVSLSLWILNQLKHEKLMKDSILHS